MSRRSGRLAGASLVAVFCACTSPRSGDLPDAGPDTSQALQDAGPPPADVGTVGVVVPGADAMSMMVDAVPPADGPPVCTPDRCCSDSDCPPQSQRAGHCDTGTGRCTYTCAAGTKPCGAECIPEAGCCTDADCKGFACTGAVCSSTSCGMAFQRCGPACIAHGTCCPAPTGRDCASPNDNDCDGRPDNTIDQACTCAPGTTRACNTHPGKDGIGSCRAGTQTCIIGTPPSTSAYGPCSGDVAPAADDCAGDGPDADCDGVRGDGATCTRKVYLYGSDPFTCGSAQASWPADLMLIDEEDPTGVPVGFSLISQLRLFRDASGTKIALYRCFNQQDGYHFTGYSGCTGGRTDRLVGYVSTINGGSGWASLSEFFGRNFGPTAIIRSDAPQCCGQNCGATTNTNYVLK